MANELRIRANFLSGVVDDNPLAVGATTLTSSALSSFPIIDTTNHALIVLDPNGSAGTPEIVKVTAHSVGATTATIVRGQEGTTARQHNQNTPWAHSLVKSDLEQPIWPLGHADKPPAPANAQNDEFDGTSPASWTPTPTAANVVDSNTTRPGHLYVKASGSGAAYVGQYQSTPASYPYTITAKLSGTTARANFHRGGGIFIAPASPTNTSTMMYCGMVYNNSLAAQRVTAQLGGTFSSQSSAVATSTPVYLRIVVNSATSTDCYSSVDGWAWIPIQTGLNPGFTPGVMGLCCNEENAAGGVEVYFDWFRIS